MATLRRAAVRATRAPSIHNTQPWRFVLTATADLEIHADRSRQLTVLDPRGRQLVLSCGCALLNARAALAAAGRTAAVARCPDPARPDLLARISLAVDGEPDPRLALLDEEIESRRTNRRQFADAPVPRELVNRLKDAVAQEGGEIVEVSSPEHRLITATLTRQADQIENLDPAYRAELRAWTSDDPSREDGVPAFAVPHVDAGSGDDIPLRDFDTRGMGWLPTHTYSHLRQCLLLIGSLEDNRMGWLRTGEALERMWLELTRAGFAASPITQLVEVAWTNAALRAELGLTMTPHVLVRVGLAPQTPATRRRRLVDVLTESV